MSNVLVEPEGGDGAAAGVARVQGVRSDRTVVETVGRSDTLAQIPRSPATPRRHSGDDVLQLKVREVWWDGLYVKWLLGRLVRAMDTEVRR